MSNSLIIAAVFGAIVFGALFSMPSPASAQRRDFLTEAEVEIVRDAQDIDTRIDVLLRMADRRFQALGIEVNGWKGPAKASEVWGDPPKGARTELLGDIKRILQKAVDDIDNLAANPDAAPIREKDDKRAKKDHERFPRAVRNLAAGADRYLGPLRTELDRATSEFEKGLMLSSIELCEQIKEAVAKLPPETKEIKKAKN